MLVDSVFYCEFKGGGWESVDPTTKVVEHETYIEVWGEAHKQLPYIFNKDDLNFWIVQNMSKDI